MENKKQLMDADEFLGKLQKLAELLKQGEISEIDINLLIASTPIVDAVEVVHGRWIEDYETFVQDNGYESEPIHTGFLCSVCGRHSCSIEPYCHCGAKMDGRGIKE